jgi:hypothetical protein
MNIKNIGKNIGKTIAGMSMLVLTVSACATPTASPVAPTSTGHPVTTLSKSEQYQIAVQQSARLNGVEVRWVNPPDESDLAHYNLAESSSETKAASN